MQFTCLFVYARDVDLIQIISEAISSNSLSNVLSLRADISSHSVVTTGVRSSSFSSFAARHQIRHYRPNRTHSRQCTPVYQYKPCMTKRSFESGIHWIRSRYNGNFSHDWWISRFTIHQNCMLDVVIISKSERHLFHRLDVSRIIRVRTIIWISRSSFSFSDRHILLSFWSTERKVVD